jgi:NAD(P)-dependent dehydrogenase (short-subunit alcohol dehydrogenase family)
MTSLRDTAVASFSATPSFSLEGRLAVVTGGYGVLGGTIASGLAAAGARVVILGRRREMADTKAAEIRRTGAFADMAVADVLDDASLRAAADDLRGRGLGEIDILVNAAGGNVARARSDNRSVFDVPLDAFDEVLRLNLHGTVAPTLIFGEMMAARRRGSIVNISSMAAMQALSGVMGYSVAKAGIDNFTRWMAVDLARRFGDGIRVNAIAPGFFLSEQNRAVLVAPDGSPTERAKKIIDRTPMARFGRPEELIGAVQWLCSDAASFVTGVVVPIDGGFSAFSGV